ncbi:MAG: hypothetical protein HUJ58_01485, partial [Erysipelotrichaceae bacterium]|nr:hypothetical protein [Erysipelotrichaceae bacterium]
MKDALREIRRSMGRYLSIMAIVCLGVGFFAGVKAAGPDMITTAQTYYETSNLMDVHFQSTLGLTDDDVKAVQGLKNVNQTETGYTLDTIQSGEEDMYVIRLISLPETISLPRLIEGRFPENENEIVVENGAIISGEYAIGSTFTLSLDSDDILDSLKTDTFTVVGLIESPLYVTYKKGPSTLASGEVDLYGMVLPEAFCMDVYTDIYVTLQSTGQLVFNSAMYKETVTNFVDGLAQFESEREEYRYNTVKTEAQEEYDKEKTKAMDKLAKAKKKLDDAKKQLDDAQKTLDANRKKAEDGFKKAQETLDEINAVLATISEEDVIAMEQGIETLTSTIADLQNQKAQSEQQLSQLEAYLATLDPASQEYTQYAGMAEQLRQGIAQIEQNLPALQAQLTELEGNYADYQQLLEGKKQCEDALSKKKSTYKKLNEAQATINTNRKKYEDGLASYKKNYKKAMDELADAQKEIDDIEYPTWYSFTRDDNEGYSEYADNANRIAAIAQVFPVFFLLIAALVCLTSMTRMVEENRTQIGSYKALGYSTLQIAAKYLLYSGSATVIGATVGLILGFRIFPTVIISAYNIMYRLPDASTPFLTEVAAYSIILSLAATFFATGMAVYKELQEVPASLLRPRSPANGK